jgi:hypothetical protein
MLEEITVVRGKMVQEINEKVRIFKECIALIGLEESFKKFKDVTCFEDAELLARLHN